MSCKVIVGDTKVELGEIKTLKSFQTTSSHKNKTCKGSVIPKLMNASWVDLEPEESNKINLILHGGQNVDTLKTSDDVIVMKGNLSCEKFSDEVIDVTRYLVAAKTYIEFKIPHDWLDGSKYIQKGDIPEGQTGSRMTKIGHRNGADSRFMSPCFCWYHS